eukprot:SAG31_NODE_1453_length_8285_cov_11.761544_3_plen_67_part_00
MQRARGRAVTLLQHHHIHQAQAHCTVPAAAPRRACCSASGPVISCDRALQDQSSRRVVLATHLHYY